MAETFDIKDSGERTVFITGMQRDSGTKTLRPDLIWLPGLIRLANHYGKGALKYAERNWEKAKTIEEQLRFQASAFRHFIQWMRGDRDEDHMSAVIFNMFGYEYVRERIINEQAIAVPHHVGQDVAADSECSVHTPSR